MHGVAGRELDALVAEKVMGWTLAPQARLDYTQHRDLPNHLYRFPDGYWVCPCSFMPSVRIDHAWRVVEEMDRRGFTTEIDKREAGWAVAFVDYKANAIGLRLESNMDIDQSMPLSICRAALAALQASRQEEG